MSDLDMKQTQRLFASLSALAFKDCVQSFRTRTLEKSEEKCIENTVHKYMAHFQRVNVRFGEEFMAKAQQQAQQAMQQQ